MKKKLLPFTLLITLLMATFTTHAAVPLGNGYVQIWDGESYGSLANDYGVNMFDLMYQNGDWDLDTVMVHPGDVVYVGDSSSYGYNDGIYAYSNPYGNTDSYNYNDSYDYSYTDTTEYYSEPTESYSESTGYYSEPTEDIYGDAFLQTQYSGNIAHNVALACEYNDGIVIPAHGTYSAFDVLGDGGYGMGFKDGAGLNSDGTSIMVPGSGICTVETIVWQSLREAGLEAVERSPHVGGYCWYAPNEEDQAMFNAGTSNLVVANPYDYDITINASYVDGRIYVSCSN